ncbi:hypothetical protein [Streptomyces sp. NBC_01497]|uniref:hypothetical protein n=1 Tax=Streptomyces sp. NBC_01497 TaxID=2903885 RepID=UPI002E311AA9|nr:hypothetical protein [Streptomyces sp. NBC_01497]
MLTAVAGLFLIALCYVAQCSTRPYGTCRRCQGWGCKIRQTRTGRLTRGRQCRRCSGYGRRLRVGRRLYNSLSHLQHEGTR